MLVLLTAGLVAAAPMFSVALPDLNAVKLATGESELYSQLLSQHLASRGVRVITARDFSAVVGLERQKELLGSGEACSDSCITELAAAMGVDAIVVGDIGKPGNSYSMSFKVLAARNGTALAIYSAQVANADAMDAALDEAAWSLMSQLKGVRPELTPGPRPGVRASSAPRKVWALAPLIIGVAALSFGAYGIAQAGSDYSKLRSAGSAAMAQQFHDSGKTMQLAGWISLGAGVVALAAAAGVFLLGASDQVSPAVSVGPGSATLGLAGRWP
jgi:hypothetical protein